MESSSVILEQNVGGELNLSKGCNSRVRRRAVSMANAVMAQFRFDLAIESSCRGPNHKHIRSANPKLACAVNFACRAFASFCRYNIFQLFALALPCPTITNANLLQSNLSK